MAADRDQIRALVQQPVEALQVELKTWIDPRTGDGIAKIVKAIFAIRNRNGGFLLFGFDNATMSPDPYAFDKPVELLFHVDVIQGLVSRYTSPSFEIGVTYQDRDGQIHPVISVPEGVTVPAVIRRDLAGEGGKKLLTEGDVYFRTFNTNGTASSARIVAADYADLLDVCFENREADIGRFLRRHLGGVGSVTTLATALGLESKSTQLRNRAFAVIEAGDTANNVAMRTAATDEERERVKDALIMHVGMVLDPAKPDQLPTQDFLNKIASSNPNFTGWPVWLDSRGFTDKASRPYVVDRVWQTCLVDLDGGWSQHMEFARYDPQGEFYLQRVMQDDLTEKVPPKTALDVILMIYRVAEVLAVGTSMGRALGWETESEAGFAFRWTGLNGRTLRPWVNAFRSFGISGNQSRSASADAYVQVPIDTPFSALAPYVASAVAPLFATFDGYSPSTELVETSVRKLIERKMD
jgi:hypothetical protein